MSEKLSECESTIGGKEVEMSAKEKLATTGGVNADDIDEAKDLPF